MKQPFHVAVCVVALAAAGLLVAACSASQKEIGGDPFEDSFFQDGMDGHSSLDEIWQQRAPNVGHLADPHRYGNDDDKKIVDDEIRRERVAAGAGQVVEAEGRDLDRDPDGMSESGGDSPARPRKSEKSFSERAQEATLATMSVLLGAGMAALPYLLGT